MGITEVYEVRDIACPVEVVRGWVDKQGGDGEGLPRDG